MVAERRLWQQHQARFGIHEVQGHSVLVRLHRHTGHGQDLQRQPVRHRQADRRKKMGVPWRKNYQLQHRHRRRTRLLRRVQLVENPERANQPNRLQQPLVEPAPRRAQPEKRSQGLEQVDHDQQFALPCRVFPHAGRGSFNPQLHHHEVLRGRLLHP